MALTERDNFLKAVKFEYPQWVPNMIKFAPAVWKKYRQDLEELVLRHPQIFPGYHKGQIDFDDAGKLMTRNDPDGPAFKKQGEYYYDAWGCLWRCLVEGIGGQAIEHPLADWKALESYKPPDLLQTTRWGQARENWQAVKKQNRAEQKEWCFNFFKN